MLYKLVITGKFLTKLSNNVSKENTNCFATYYLHFNKKLGMIKFIHKSFFSLSIFKRNSLQDISFDSTVQVIKLLYDISKQSIQLFLKYHLYQKYILVNNQSLTFICITNILNFLNNWSNLLVVFFLTYKANTYIIEPGLVIKMRELLKTFIYPLFYIVQPPYLLFS